MANNNPNRLFQDDYVSDESDFERFDNREIEAIYRRVISAYYQYGNNAQCSGRLQWPFTLYRTGLLDPAARCIERLLPD
jgi:hypothetical protein